MRRHLAFLVGLSAVGLIVAGRVRADSWIFRRSSFTHDPATGDRVVQFARPKPLRPPGDGTYQQSAYRHYRSTIRAGSSADHMHVVQTWGEGERIRPYGEWERPFREGATPYGPWGNPSGPWTTPYGSWVNPYGLGKLPNPYWRYWPYAPYYPAPMQPAVPVPAAPGGSLAEEDAD